MLEVLNLFVEEYPFPLWEAVVRVFIAMLLGSLIGVERERRSQPAGFRTHSVLAVGSALLSIVSIYIPSVYGTGVNVDPSRIASQVVSGIGFLGAGAILRMGISVKGLTTAASLWTTAGIGLAVGAGMYVLSVVSTLLLLILLSFMSKIEKEFLYSGTKILKVSIQGDDLTSVEEVLKEGSLKSVRNEGGVRILTYEVRYSDKKVQDRIKKLAGLENVVSVEVV